MGDYWNGQYEYTLPPDVRQERRREAEDFASRAREGRLRPGEGIKLIHDPGPALSAHGAGKKYKD